MAANKEIAIRYDGPATSSIVDKIRLMATVPSGIPEAVIHSKDTSWASTIAAQLYLAMYIGDVRACSMILDRLDGRLVRQVEIITTPVEVRVIRSGDRIALISDGIVQLGLNM